MFLGVLQTLLPYITFKMKNVEALQSQYRQFKIYSQNKPWKGWAECSFSHPTNIIKALKYFLDLELISYRYSRCSFSCSSWCNRLQKKA